MIHSSKARVTAEAVVRRLYANTIYTHICKRVRILIIAILLLIRRCSRTRKR